MSEKPQNARADGQEDLLEQITAQGLEKITPPAQTAAEPETPSGKRKDSTALTDRKTRRSGVYLYLLVLFGAAFLMLLLAYFIQRRNNENPTSDLRESAVLSQEEPLSGIGASEGHGGVLSNVIFG